MSVSTTRTCRPLLERQVLGHGQRDPRGQQPFDGRVVGAGSEQHGALEGGALGEPAAEERGLATVTPMAAKTTANSSSDRARAPGGDLRGEVVRRQAGAGEDRQFLAADQRVQSVDRRDAGLDELGGLGAAIGLSGSAVDVAVAPPGRSSGPPSRACRRRRGRARSSRCRRRCARRGRGAAPTFRGRRCRGSAEHLDDGRSPSSSSTWPPVAPPSPVTTSTISP